MVIDLVGRGYIVTVLNTVIIMTLVILLNYC